jgi:hypothetical protein
MNVSPNNNGDDVGINVTPTPSINKGVFFNELEKKFKHKGTYKYAYFFNSTKFLFQRVINNLQNILNNKVINFRELFGEEHEDKFLKFQAVNSLRVGEDGFLLDKDIESDLFSLLQRVAFDNHKFFDEREAVNVYTTTFDDCEVVGDDLLSPKSSLDKTSFFYSLFKNKFVGFVFNKSLSSDGDSSMYVSKKRFLLQGQMLRKADIPTKYKITCKHPIINKDEPGKKPVVCNQIVYCSPVDGVHSVVKCGRGHTVKEIDKATPEETREFFIYRALDVTNRSDSELSSGGMLSGELVELFSLVSLGEDGVEEFWCNAVPTYNSGQTKMNFFVLNYEPVSNKKPLKNPILLRDRDKHFCFLNDVFESIKYYYKTVHKQTINNQNKVVGLSMVLQYLCQRFLGSLYPALFCAKTGTGKSFYYSLLSECLFDNSVVVQPSVRRNQFIGGQDSVSILGNKLFLPGFVQTKSFIFVEEMAEKIEEYLNNKHNKQYDVDGNLFSMHKQCYDSGGRKEINVGIQGSFPVMVNAVPCSVGNSTSLKSNTRKYYKRLKLEYEKLGGVGVPSRKVPFFKPLRYYIDVLQDDLLAKAHAVVRADYESFFMTGLDFAEQSRFTFFYMVDDLDETLKVQEGVGDEGVLRRRERVGTRKRLVHKRELVDELEELLGGLRVLSKDQEEFLDVVNDWVDRWLDREVSQFSFDVGDVPTHLKKNLARMNSDLLLLHKTYYGLPLEFLEEDKSLLVWWNSYNYSLLSVREAAMVVKPLVDGPKVVDLDVVENEMHVQGLRRRAEAESLGVTVSDDLVGAGEEFDRVISKGLFEDLPDEEFSNNEYEEEV